MSRVLVHEPRYLRDDFSRLLAGEGHDVEVCRGREGLFDQLTERRPDVLVYVLGDLAVDLAVLTLLRRVAARLPIILLGGPAGLEARRSVQELKPVYYGVFPLEPAELSEAVRGALGHPHDRYDDDPVTPGPGRPRGKLGKGTGRRVRRGGSP